MFELIKMGGGEVFNTSAGKRAINNFARDLNFYADRIDSSTSRFGDASSIIAQTAPQLAIVFGDFDARDENIAALEEMLETMSTTLEGSPQYVIGFKDVMTAMPRLSTKANQAKRSVVQALEKFLTILEQTSSVVAEAQQLVISIKQSSKE